MTHGPTYLPYLAFLWGLAGGFSHCIGMCGIFVAMYSNAAGSAGKGLHPERHIMFHGGRLFSLTTLGVIGGLLGTIGHGWAQAQGWISLAAGIVLICLALGFAGIIPAFRIPEPDVLGAGGGRLRKLFVRVLQSDHKLRPLFIGMFVGLLPCGLTYQALIPSALSGSPGHGALTMFLFGLGGVPGLLTLGVFGGALMGRFLMNPIFRTRMTYVSAVIMAVMGAAFIVRAIPNM